MRRTPLGEEALTQDDTPGDTPDRVEGNTMFEYEFIQQRSAELQARAAHERRVREALEARPARERRFGGLFGRLGGAASRSAAAEQRPVTARLGEC